MLVVGIILLFVVGFLAVSALSPNLSYAERLGLSFPSGAALVTFFMLLVDAVGLPIGAATNIAISVVLMIVGGVLCWLQRKDILSSLQHRPDVSSYNLVWCVLLIFIIGLEYANFKKCMFFPTYDRDSLAAFDTIGFLIGQEHTFHSLSIFVGDYMPGIHGPGSPIAYTPMLELAYGYVYSLGSETSKIIPGLLYLSFLFAFYGVTARFTSKTMAMLATLLLLLTPEMTSFSSLSGTNTVHAVYAGLGVAYFIAWFKENHKSDLWLGSFLLAANVWARAEGIVFLLAVGLFVLVKAVCRKRFLPLIPMVLTFVPMVVWALYTKAFGMTSVSVVSTHLAFDGVKAAAIWAGAKDLLCNSTYYGWTFYAALLALFVDICYVVKRKGNLLVPGILLLSIVLYFLVLYQIDYKWDSMDNVLKYSAKRFMFCFVGIAWFYVATCEAARRISVKFDKWMACR